MAYDSYKMTQTIASPTPQSQMMYDKAKQVEYLYAHAMDRVDGCLINGITFTESPRIFDRKTRSDYLQVITVETINTNDRLHTGDMLQFDGYYWLCATSFVFHELYCRGTFFRCNYTLLFQRLTDYAIISVPCITSGKTFDVDESKVISLGSNKKSLLCARTPDTLSLKTDRRVYIDTRNETPYKLLDPDTTTYNYGENGLIYIIAEQNTVQITDGDLPKDRPDLGICNYHEPIIVPPIPVGESYSTLKSSGDIIIGSTRARTITAICYNADDTINTDAVLVWNIVLPVGYENLFTIAYPTSRTCTVKCANTDDYDKLVGKVVGVNVSDGNGGFVGSLDVKIRMS